MSDKGIENKQPSKVSSDGGLENENPKQTGKEQGERDEKGRFKPGVSGNPNGRPKGTRNWRTDFEMAIEKVADDMGKTKSEVRTALLQKGLQEAMRGSAKFWTYIIDRDYGKEPQPIDADINVPGAKDMANTLQQLLGGPASDGGVDNNENVQNEQKTKDGGKKDS